MAYFRKCRTCKHNTGDCQIKEGLRQSIKGLGITSLLHRCSEFEPIYKFGDTISVKTCDSMGPQYDECGGPAFEAYAGWFIQESAKRKAIVYIRPGTEAQNVVSRKAEAFSPRDGRGFCSIPYSDIHKLQADIGSPPVCSKCLSPFEPEGHCSCMPEYGG